MRLVPFKHQVLGTNYLLDNNGGAIYSDPRTGKSLMVLRALEKSRKFPALIICPSTVIASWYGSLIEDEVNPVDIVRIQSTTKTVAELKSLLMCDAKYVIVNYEKIEKLDIFDFRNKLSDIFGLKDWRAIILDESYRISSFDSSVSQYVMSLEYNPDQMRACLTGTPICESVMDAVQPYIFLNGSFMGYKNPFKYRECNYENYNFKWKPKNRIHTAKVEKFIKENSFQVRLADLGLGGEIFRGLEIIEMSDVQKKLYRWASVTSTYEKDGESREMYSPIRSMFYHKISSGIHPLTNEIIDLQKAHHIANHFELSKERILVLSRFKTILKPIQNVLNQYGIKSEIICGDTSMSDREEIRKRFQAGDLDMVIAQIDTVARGLDFSSLDKIYYYASTYSYESRKQSELRGQNVKRKLPYTVTDLCFEDSIDIEIRKILLTKESNVSNFIKQIDLTMLGKWSES